MLFLTGKPTRNTRLLCFFVYNKYCLFHLRMFKCSLVKANIRDDIFWWEPKFPNCKENVALKTLQLSCETVVFCFTSVCVYCTVHRFRSGPCVCIHSLSVYVCYCWCFFFFVALIRMSLITCISNNSNFNGQLMFCFYRQHFFIPLFLLNYSMYHKVTTYAF